jgi:Cysteine dioxygenase type I
MTATLRPADRDLLNPTGRPLTVPYLHPALAAVAPLAGALAPRRPLWTPGELARLTDLLVRTAPGTLRRLAGHDPRQRWYGRLALTEQVEVWLIGWAPGQGTRPHDHGGASGAFTVLDGRLAETYRDGGAPLRRAVVGPLQGSAFGPERLHLVANGGAVNATSVQAYSPPLLPLGERDTLDDIGTELG